MYDECVERGCRASQTKYLSSLCRPVPFFVSTPFGREKESRAGLSFPRSSCSLLPSPAPDASRHEIALPSLEKRFLFSAPPHPSLSGGLLHPAVAATDRRRTPKDYADADADSGANAEVAFIGSAQGKAERSTVVVDPDYSSGDDDDDDDDEHDSADEWDDDDDNGEVGALREPEAVLSRPVGTDAAAARLSETVSVELPQEGILYGSQEKQVRGICVVGGGGGGA